MTQLGTASGDWHGARLARIALVTAIGLGVAPTAAAAPNGPPGPQGNPGSERAQEVRSQKQPERGSARSQAAPGRRAHGAPAGSEGRKMGASKGRKVRRRGAPKPTEARQAPSRTAPAQAKAGKTTICHSTGSATNPYVTITVSNNALKAHGRHHDGRDIIPAPEGGCETAAPAADTAVAGVNARRRAQRRADRAGEESPSRRVPPSAVLGARASSPSAEGASRPLAEEEREEDAGSLPFTGLALVGVLATALLMLAGGTAFRRYAGRTDA